MGIAAYTLLMQSHQMQFLFNKIHKLHLNVQRAGFSKWRRPEWDLFESLPPSSWFPTPVWPLRNVVSIVF